MRRIFLSLAVVGLLAACTTSGDGGGFDESSAANPSAATASGSADAAGSEVSGGSASAACAEAFAPIADLGVESASDLGDLAEVEATVANCESVEDWRAGATAALGSEVNAGTADLLLRIRCEDPGLGSAPICEELASS
jgi:hypothetical protein